MTRIIVFNSVTLDGVMQAPGRPGEDDHGGFAHGGWAAPRGDAVMGSAPGVIIAVYRAPRSAALHGAGA